MAITKMIGVIHPSKKGDKFAGMGRTIEYVLNPNKTQGGQYTGALNCSANPMTAQKEMIATKAHYGKTSDSKSERYAYHWGISWSPEEVVAPDIALQITREFCEIILSEYEVVYSVHLDKAHIHAHMCFNSVNINTGRKFRYEDGDWARLLQPVTDRLCEKYGLHTLYVDTGVTNEEYEKERGKKKRYKPPCDVGQAETEGAPWKKRRSNNKYYKENGWRGQENRTQAQRTERQNARSTSQESFKDWNCRVRADIDEVVLQSKSYEDFLERLKWMGYGIKFGNSRVHGETLKLHAPGMEIYRRTYQLGMEYTVDAIKTRITVKDKPLPNYVRSEEDRLIVPTHYLQIPAAPRRGRSSIQKQKRAKQVLPEVRRRYYRSLYRLGVRKIYKKPDYAQRRRARASCAHMQQKLITLMERNLQTESAAKQALDAACAKRAELEAKRKAFTEKHAPYQSMVKKYNKAKRLKTAYDKYFAGDTTFETQAKDFEALCKRLTVYGFTLDEISRYVDEKKEEERALRKEGRDLEAEISLLDEIYHDARQLRSEQEQVVQEQTKQEQTKQEQTKQEQTKQERTKQEQTKQEQTKQEQTVQEGQEDLQQREQQKQERQEQEEQAQEKKAGIKKRLL